MGLKIDIFIRKVSFCFGSKSFDNIFKKKEEKRDVDWMKPSEYFLLLIQGWFETNKQKNGMITSK